MKIKFKYLLWIIVILLISEVKARPSEAGVIFLNISPGSRATGMGDAFVALADDATATYWNPAGLGIQKGSEVNFMHVNWLPGFNIGDMYYDFLTYKQEIEGLGTVGGNITYFYLGEQKRTGEVGEEMGVFKTYEFQVTLAYGTMLTNNLSIGLSTKFIYSHLADQGAGNEKGSGTGHSVAVDMGVLYEVTPDFSIGATISNMGPKISYIDYEQADPLPTNLKAGIAYRVMDDEFNSLVVTADMNKLLVKRGDDLDGNGKIEDDEWNEIDPLYKAFFTSWTDDDGVKDIIWGIGAEYWYDNMVALRAGYWNDNLGDISATTFGASLKLSDYIIDLSYLDERDGHPLSDTMRFGFTILFD